VLIGKDIAVSFIVQYALSLTAKITTVRSVSVACDSSFEYGGTCVHRFIGVRES
jgi:hypothetical protein